MKTPLILAAALLSLVIDAREIPMVKPDRAGMAIERLARISQLTERYVAEGKLAGAVTVVARGGKIVHVSAVGQRGVDDSRPLPEDALFRIYSMTMPMTAVAAMILYEEGKFQLTDPVAKYLPELAELDVLVEGERVAVQTPITMRHLLTHTAGFSYGFDGQDPVDELYRQVDPLGAENLDQFVTRLATLPLKFEPGTRWHYSVAFDVVGAVVERLSGQRFDTFLQERLFDPLDMPDTFFNIPADKLPRFVPNHFWDSENAQLIKVDSAGSDSFTDTSLYSGGGGLVSTARDYLRFAEMLRGGGALDEIRILSPKTVEFMVTNHLPASVYGAVQEAPTGLDAGVSRPGFGFGLGLGLVTDVAGVGVIGSVGEYSWGGAAGTIFWVDPIEDIVVVSMMQVMGSPWPLRSELKVLTNQAIIELN